MLFSTSNPSPFFFLYPLPISSFLLYSLSLSLSLYLSLSLSLTRIISCLRLLCTLLLTVGQSGENAAGEWVSFFCFFCFCSCTAHSGSQKEAHLLKKNRAITATGSDNLSQLPYSTINCRLSVFTFDQHRGFYPKRHGVL